MIAKAWRAQLDKELAAYMKQKIYEILENDQICYREDPQCQNEYKKNLAKLQVEKTDPLFEFLKTRFGIKLKVWHNIAMDSQDKSFKKIKPILDNFDPFVLNSIYQVAQLSKSSALALALIYQDGSDPEAGHINI